MPTPEPACWDGDLRRMRELRHTAVCCQVRWRWAHRLGARFTFVDLDVLMNLAQAKEE